MPIHTGKRQQSFTYMAAELLSFDVRKVVHILNKLAWRGRILKAAHYIELLHTSVFILRPKSMHNFRRHASFLNTVMWRCISLVQECADFTNHERFLCLWGHAKITNQERCACPWERANSSKVRCLSQSVQFFRTDSLNLLLKRQLPCMQL